MAGANHRAPAVGHRGRRLWNRYTFPILAVFLCSMAAGLAAIDGETIGAVWGLGWAGLLSLSIIRIQAIEAREQATIEAMRQRADAAFPRMQPWHAN